MFDCIAALVKKVGNFFRDSFCFYGFLIAKFNPNSLPDLNKTPEDRPTLTVSAKLHHDNQENFCKNITIQEKTSGLVGQELTFQAQTFFPFFSQTPISNLRFHISPSKLGTSWMLSGIFKKNQYVL